MILCRQSYITTRLSGPTWWILQDVTNLSKLEPQAQAVLDARAAHPEATLADLYDPDLMPPDLRKAHQTLDRVVDKPLSPYRVRI